MRLIDADAFDKTLSDAQAECKRNGGNFRFGVLSNVRENLRMMPTVEQERRWIPVSERLPEERHSVLVYCPEYRNIFCAYYYKDAWLFFGGRHERIDEKVSHWMVLPESPIEDGGDGDGN